MEGYRRARTAAARRNQQMPSLSDMAAEQDPVRRDQIHREVTELGPLFVMPPRPDNSSSTVASRLAQYAARRMEQRNSRPRMTPSDRYLERQRHVAERELRDAASRNVDHESMQDAGRQLEAASSNLRARLDAPLPNVLSPLSSEIEYASEIENRRSKRRKLNTDKTDSGFSGFSYGKYGQVEQGKLVMEIVSCDGGTFEGEPPSRREDFEPENVLLDDKSVYCTKSNRCNLVLRHQGSTTFCLTELIIKAPRQNYTAPYGPSLLVFKSTLTSEQHSRGFGFCLNDIR
jgi:hypothetical protein